MDWSIEYYSEKLAQAILKMPSQKTPVQELETARKRLTEVLRNEP